MTGRDLFAMICVAIVGISGFLAYAALLIALAVGPVALLVWGGIKIAHIMMGG